MIKKVIFAGIVLCLFIAVPLALMGINHVELGQPFMTFLRNCNLELNQYKVEIPDIPEIPTPPNPTGWLLILKAFVAFMNFFVKIINVFTSILSTIIQLFQFLGIMIKNLITLKDSLAAQACALPSTLSW